MFSTSSRVVLFFVAFVGCTTKDGNAPSAPPPDLPAQAGPALAQAHGAYLEGDYFALGERVRDVLLDPASSDGAKENALELLDKGYEVNKGKLPSRQQIPPGFEFLSYGVAKWQSPYGATNRISLRARVRGPSRIAAITLKRLPDQVILDKESGRGKFRTEPADPGEEDFVIDSGNVDVLPDDGVFSLRIVREGGASWEGWFIGRSLHPTTAPELVTPAALPVSFSEANPRLAWKPFRSPQYLPFEKRTLGIYVSREPDGTAWDYWTGTPGELGEVKIGDHPNATKTKLAPGEYWMMINGGEERTFGPFRLGRTGSTVGSFHVVP